MKILFNYLEFKRCFGCNQIGEYFCIKCQKDFASASFRLNKFTELKSVVQYSPPMMRAIAAWKDRHLKNLTKTFADLLLQVEPSLQASKHLQIVTPPHLYASYAKRGFNPVQELGFEIQSRNSNLIYNPKAARLIRQPKDQRGLDPKMRKLNVAGAFEVVLESDVPVIVLDDVWTTGSTALEMTRAIGVKRVSKILVLATTYKIGARNI